MSLLDHLSRIDAIVTKYDQYGDNKPEKEKERNRPSDAFESLYQRLEDTIDNLDAKVEENQAEKQASVRAMVNAEIRRCKASLRTEIPKLQKLFKKHSKGLGQEIMEDRMMRMEELTSRIEGIPDGLDALVAKQAPVLDANHVKINIADSSETEIMEQSSIAMSHTEESRAFKEEFEMAKVRQDKHLDDISRGLTTLKELGHDMERELGKQTGLVDDIDTKMDRANQELKQNNAKLKNIVTSVRSSRNFCLDIVLLSLLLGIGAYIYNMVK